MFARNQNTAPKPITSIRNYDIMDDEEIWKTIKEPVTRFTESIKAIRTNVDRLINFYHQHVAICAPTTDSKICNDNETKKLSPLALAKLEISIVHALNACYWLCLITHGEDPSNTEVSKTLERIKLFMNRAREVEESTKTSDSLSCKRPKIDKGASKRLCMNNMTILKNK